MPANQAPEFIPRLLADIGGTNARFALETSPGRFDAVSVLPCADYPGPGDAVRAYLTSEAARAAGGALVRKAAVAIANPVDGDQIRMTNHHWAFSIEALRQELGFESILVVNDFKALALALPYLRGEDKMQLGGGPAKPASAIGLIGPGTGLGVSGLVPAAGGWAALDSEGGHVSFAPANEMEMEILRFAWRRYPHVSAERLISGTGMPLVYEALANLKQASSETLDAAEIVRRALAGECELCSQALACFCEMLGTVAGNLAVTLGAKGGVYIGGGIVPRLGDYFLRSGFRSRFEQKGRFSHFLSQIPVYVITARYPAFLGLSSLLAEPG